MHRLSISRKWHIILSSLDKRQEQQCKHSFTSQKIWWADSIRKRPWMRERERELVLGGRREEKKNWVMIEMDREEEQESFLLFYFAGNSLSRSNRNNRRTILHWSSPYLRASHVPRLTFDSRLHHLVDLGQIGPVQISQMIARVS